MAYQTLPKNLLINTGSMFSVESISSVLTPVVKASSYILPMTNQKKDSKVPSFHPVKTLTMSGSQE